jgi:hypothetical protein
MQNFIFSPFFPLDIRIYKGMGICFEVGKKRVYEKSSSYVFSRHLTHGITFVLRWVKKGICKNHPLCLVDILYLTKGTHFLRWVRKGYIAKSSNVFLVDIHIYFSNGICFKEVKTSVGWF